MIAIQIAIETEIAIICNHIGPSSVRGLAEVAVEMAQDVSSKVPRSVRGGAAVFGDVAALRGGNLEGQKDGCGESR